MSKETVSFLLDTSEWAVLISGFVLCFGIVGEYKTGEWWKKHIKKWEMLVILGVAFELIGDGGIFFFSKAFQRIEGQEISSLDTMAKDAAAKALQAVIDSKNASTKAAQANADADTARVNAGIALTQSGQAIANSGDAKVVARSAATEASAAKDKVNILGKQTKSIDSELADAQSFLSEREILDPNQLRKDLAKFSKKPIFFRSYIHDGDAYFLCKGLVFIAVDVGVQAFDECGTHSMERLERPEPIRGIYVVSPDDEMTRSLGNVMFHATRYGSVMGKMGGGPHSPITLVFIGRKPAGKASITTKPGEIVDTVTFTF